MGELSETIFIYYHIFVVTQSKIFYNASVAIIISLRYYRKLPGAAVCFYYI